MPSRVKIQLRQNHDIAEKDFTYIPFKMKLIRAWDE
jgi:hypothetical protein